jgi:MFS family permease
LDNTPADRDPDSPIPGVTRNVFALGLVSFFNDLGSEMLYPIVPLFLTLTLGAPVAVVGLIEGAAETTASLLKIFSGWYSDKVGRRLPLIVSGYALSGVAKPLLAFAGSWTAVLGLRLADRFGKGIRTAARDALIADSTESRYRGRAFGFHRSMDSAGAVVGPLATLLVLGAFGEASYRPVFLAALIPAVISLFCFFLVHERRRPARDGAAPTFGLRGFSREFKVFLFASFLFSLGNSSDAFLILRAKDLFNVSDVALATTLTVLAYALYNVVYTAAATPAGILSDRIGRRGLWIGGLVIFALVYVGFALASTGGWVWPLFAIYGLYIALTDGTGRALAVDMSDPAWRGTALGTYHLVLGITTFAASLIGGILWQLLGAPATFLYGAALALVAAGVFALAGPSRATSLPAS